MNWVGQPHVRKNFQLCQGVGTFVVHRVVAPLADHSQVGKRRGQTVGGKLLPGGKCKNILLKGMPGVEIFLRGGLTAPHH